MVLKVLLSPSFPEARSFWDYTHPERPLYRSTLDQLIVINPRNRDRTYLEFLVQEFSSAVRHAVP